MSTPHGDVTLVFDDATSTDVAVNFTITAAQNTILNAIACPAILIVVTVTL